MRSHHPVDRRATGIAPEAVPEIGFWGDDAGRRVVPLVPRATAGEILPLRDELVSMRRLFDGVGIKVFDGVPGTGSRVL